MLDSEDGYLTPPNSSNPSQSVFLFVRPRDSSKSHYRPYSTLYTPPSPPLTSREPFFSSPDRPISMMGFKKPSKSKLNDDRPSSSSGNKSGGISFFGKTMKKKRSLNGLRLLNDATEPPLPPSIALPYSPAPSDTSFSDSSHTLLNSSNASSVSSSRAPSEEQHVTFPRVSTVLDDEDLEDKSAVEKYTEKNGWLERRMTRLHRYGSEAPYMLSYDSVMLENDRHFYMLLRRVNPMGTPSFYNYLQNGTVAPSSALDLGCGAGHWILDAATHWKHAQIVGFDLVDVTLPEVHERENIKFVRGNFVRYPLPFPPNTFDLVRMANLSFCIPSDRLEFLFNEVSRVLRPDGRLEYIDDQSVFPYFNSSAFKLEYHGEKSMSISDRDEEVSKQVDPTVDAVPEPSIPSSDDVKTSDEPSFWDDDEDDDDDDETENESPLSSHSYRIDTSSAVYDSSSSSSSVDSHEDKPKLPLEPLEIKLETESVDDTEIKVNRRLSRPLPIPGIVSTPARPLPRPPSTISIDTCSDRLSISSIPEDAIKTPTSAREARAVECAIRASLDEQVDAMAVAMGLQASLDEQNPSPLSISIPSNRDRRLLPSPLPDSPTEPTFQPSPQPSPIIAETPSALETPTMSSPEKPISPSTIQSPTTPSSLSPMPSEWASKADAAKELETVYKGMLAEQYGIDPNVSRYIPDMLKRIFGPERTGRLATMHLMLAPEEMTEDVKTLKHMRGRALTGDKRWMSIEWDKKEKTRKEANSRPISPIVESRSSTESISATPTPTPSKIIPEGISAKAAGRLGITYSELTAASVSAAASSRPSTSSSGSSRNSMLASSARSSCDSQDADRTQPTIVEPEPCDAKQKAKQSSGLLLWPSTFIPMNPTELEMHACKGMHELLGSKHALAEYIASKKDEDGKPIVDEQEFEDAVWQYDCFRRQRLNWPSNPPELTLDFTAPEMSGYEDNVELPYTPTSSSTLAEAIVPKASTETERGSRFGHHTHVRTIRVYEAIKTRPRRMTNKA
ncbi:hypothetical protein VKT23_005534 [Stygiomarasmius scandens]|uniref:Methyltransferase domain-containing protein n=1 Tax=Marasmiellus scandens TaxID=2682957 RepID=A0ABR1JSI3_9AGAR